MKTRFSKFYARLVNKYAWYCNKRQAHKRARKYDVNKDWVDKNEPRLDEDGEVNYDFIDYREN